MNLMLPPAVAVHLPRSLGRSARVLSDWVASPVDASVLTTVSLPYTVAPELNVGTNSETSSRWS